ncbi:MAG: hypothetical protein ACI8P9_000693 [Parasphingorhabdus sp.]|jgi:hypothetical protein
MLMTKKYVIKCLCILSLISFGDGLANTIAKCQDAQGAWHYGDYASQECATSEITELRENGLTSRVLKPPLTAEELEAERTATKIRQENALKIEQKARIDSDLLKKYPKEQNIFDLLKIKEIELNNQIIYNQNYLEKLRQKIAELSKPKNEREEQDLYETKQLRDRFMRALNQSKKALTATQDDFKTLLERYRQIKIPEN